MRDSDDPATGLSGVGVHHGGAGARKGDGVEDRASARRRSSPSMQGDSLAPSQVPGAEGGVNAMVTWLP
jgi:hypothetical protein